MSSVLYILLEQNTEVSCRDVYLADVAQLACGDADALNRIKRIKLLKIPSVKKFRRVFSVVDVVAEIQKLCPRMQVENLGETNFIVTYAETPAGNIWLDRMKTAVISVILFVGSAFSIMTFNNDVDVQRLFQALYQQLTGEPPKGFTLLELGYSVGLTAGILIFFNHLPIRRTMVDPTPLEVQMKNYERDLNSAMIEEISRKGKGCNGN